MNISTRPGRSRLLLAVSVTISVGLFVAIGLIVILRGSEKDAASARLTIAIKNETAKLGVKPGAIHLLSDDAARVLDAIRRRDYSTADEITASVLARSTLQDWRFYPFNDFIANVTKVNYSSLGRPLTEWIVQDKSDPIPLLFRAEYYYRMGWLKRGHNFASETRNRDRNIFGLYMKKALADVDAALRLNDGDPYGFYLKLLILRGSGFSPEMQSTFEAGTARYPGYYGLYQLVLDTLEPKWGGSVGKMYGFVDQYAGKAVKHSPLKLLYLDLYRDLLSSAYTDCVQYIKTDPIMRRCIDSTMQKSIRVGLIKHVEESLDLYNHSDKYQFGLAIANILFDMLRTPGGDRYSVAVLQLAASVMHSDTQLFEKKPGHNNYIIDEAVAQSWYEKGYYDNARRKYKEALKDIKFSQFPSEQEKSAAVAGIYNDLASVYNSFNRYGEMIAYEKASVAMGGETGGETLICYGYYKLRHYDEAVRACTKAIKRTGDLRAHYWRGMAYRDSGRTDAALPDLTVVADSENVTFRTSAAIAISVIYAKLKEIRKSLEALNKYTYLFDSNAQTRGALAVSYNNRCYDYMQLGELQKALADCTTSLKYGSLPDAFRKEQELIKRLKVNQTGL